MAGIETDAQDPQGTIAAVTSSQPCDRGRACSGTDRRLIEACASMAASGMSVVYSYCPLATGAEHGVPARLGKHRILDIKVTIDVGRACWKRAQ